MAEENEYWVNIPSVVVKDRELSSGAKILYGLIYGLANNKKNKYTCCYAANPSLAKALNVDRRTVERQLSEISRAGYVVVEGKTNKRHIIPTTDRIVGSTTDRTEGSSPQLPTGLSQTTDKTVAKKGLHINDSKKDITKKGKFSLPDEENFPSDSAEPIVALSIEPKAEVKEIFDRFCERTGKNFTLSLNIQQMIVRRLSINHNKEDCLLAIDGFAANEWIRENKLITPHQCFAELERFERWLNDGKELKEKVERSEFV